MIWFCLLVLCGANEIECVLRRRSKTGQKRATVVWGKGCTSGLLAIDGDGYGCAWCGDVMVVVVVVAAAAVVVSSEWRTTQSDEAPWKEKVRGEGRDSCLTSSSLACAHNK